MRHIITAIITLCIALNAINALAIPFNVNIGPLTVEYNISEIKSHGNSVSIDVGRNYGDTKESYDILLGVDAGDPRLEARPLDDGVGDYYPDRAMPDKESMEKGFRDRLSMGMAYNITVVNCTVDGNEAIVGMLIYGPRDEETNKLSYRHLDIETRFAEGGYVFKVYNQYKPGDDIELLANLNDFKDTIQNLRVKVAT